MAPPSSVGHEPRPKGVLRRERARGDFARGVNLGPAERVASALGGAALALYGTRLRSIPGLALAALGGALIYRGVSGHSELYRMLGVNPLVGGGHRVRGNLGIKVERRVRVEASPARVYRFWRDLENLPRFMSHLERVRVLDDRRSCWTVRAPAGMTVEWDAEIINDLPNELIAWRSLAAAAVDHAGSVRFEPAPDGEGTIVHVSLQYDPPGGAAGHAVAALFGEDPGRQIEEDLLALGRAMEVSRRGASSAGEADARRVGLQPGGER